MNDNDNDVLIEHIDDQLKSIAEGQTAMASVPGDIAALTSDMAEVKSDIQAIKAAVTDQSQDNVGVRSQQEAQFKDHETRIAHLEERAA